MKDNKARFAVKVIGTVVAGLFAFGVAAGPADASARQASGHSVQVRDTGW